MKAIDVSEYQGRISWWRVHKDGIRHAFVKATEGTTLVDRRLRRNVRGCRRHGVAVSLYHFAHPGESPLANAHHFLRSTHGLIRVGDPAPVLDLEVSEGLTSAALTRWARAFFSVIDNHFGTEGILYSYLDFLERDVFPLPAHPVWGADYGSVPADVLATWSAWQYSSAGRVRGISGPVDLDSIRKQLPTVRRIP